MNLSTQSQRTDTLLLPTHYIDIVEPDLEDCPSSSLLPEGNVKLRNYRLLSENLRAYSPTGDIHISPAKDKLVSRFDVCTTISPPRSKILELLQPDDPERDAIEAIVRPTPARRSLVFPLDEDARRFLQRNLLSPNSQCVSASTSAGAQNQQKLLGHAEKEHHEQKLQPREEVDSNMKTPILKREKSLADELREAEDEERTLVSESTRQDILREYRKRAAMEREQLGRLALSVEDDECERDEGGLGAAARRLDALLAESRDLHLELAGIDEDIQTACSRALRCSAAARALVEESRSLQFLDDVLSLLKGDVSAAATARNWPFALGPKRSERNYIV